MGIHARRACPHHRRRRTTHSIQGLEEGCEFLLVFDNGSFSENETFLITDLFKHTPRDVLAKNFGVPEAAFANIPIDVEHERYIFSGKVPGPMSADVVQSGAGIVPQTFSHHMMAQEPIKAAGGWVRITDSSNFPAATTIAAALVNIEPGAMREIHWHAKDEWQYYISGRGRMTVFASGEKARTFDYQAGDVGYVPFAMAHYVQNLGDEPLRFLEMFRSARFMDVSLNQWMALTPPELVQAHLNLDPGSQAGTCDEYAGGGGITQAMQHAVALPGNVQKRPLRGRLAEPVDGLNPTGTGAGTLESDSDRDERIAQAKEICRLRKDRKK